MRYGPPYSSASLRGTAAPSCQGENGGTLDITFLGILIDTVKQQLELPPRKLTRIQRLIRRWRACKSFRKRDLLSLISHLHHAATVVRQGRAFVRGIIDLSCKVKRRHHHVRLTKLVRADLAWWAEFLPRWNGTSFFQADLPSVLVTSDASGSWGCGAYSDKQWLQVPWPVTWISNSIARKEMAPIILAASVWGPTWVGKRVCFRSDNTAVVSALKSGSARDPVLSHQLRCLHFYSALCQFTYTACHIPGKHNRIADALSRNRVTEFFALFPQADPISTPIPKAVLELLFLGPWDWTSRRWRARFAASLI